MSEYVSNCELQANGQQIEDFKTFAEGELELFQQVKLMNKTGHAGKTPRYTFKVDYVVPLEASEFDWESLRNGTFSVEYENGVRVTYSGVYTLKIGEMKVDGENETVRAIELSAEKRVKE